MSLSIRYEEGAIPKSLRAVLDKKFVRQVMAISHGGGYSTTSGNAYDVLLRPGWSVEGCEHLIIEPSIADVLDKLRTVGPCDCAQCQHERTLYCDECGVLVGRCFCQKEKGSIA